MTSVLSNEGEEDLLNILSRLDRPAKVKGDLRIRIAEERAVVAQTSTSLLSVPSETNKGHPAPRKFSSASNLGAFATDFQVGSSLLETNEEIQRHHHPNPLQRIKEEEGVGNTNNKLGTVETPSDDGLDRMFSIMMKMNTLPSNKVDLRTTLQSDERIPNSEGSPRRGTRLRAFSSVPPGTSHQEVKNMVDANRLTQIGPYILEEVIGSGATAEVKLGIHSKTGQKKAVKIIEKAQFGAKSIILMAREIAVMKSLSHPNIVSLDDVLETETHLYLVMPYIEGESLFDLLVNSEEVLSTSQVISYIGQLFSAMNYMHKHRLCHRDLKPENILTSVDRKTLYVCDFGLSRLTVRDNASVLLNTQCGSFGYNSPEQLKKGPYNGEKIDMWALGVIFYILLIGFHPFDQGEAQAITARRVMCAKFELPNKLPDELKDLICRLLRLEPEERLSAEEALKHPAMKEFKSAVDASTILTNELATAKPPVKTPETEAFSTFSYLEWGKHQDIRKSLEDDSESLEKVFYKNFLNFEARRNALGGNFDLVLEKSKTLAYAVEKCFENHETNVLEAFITRHEAMKEGLVFLVQVEVRDSSGWSVHTFRKKHSDFRKLHGKLKKSLPSKEYTVSFPTTSILNSLDNVFTPKEKINKDKRDLLNNWLAEITHNQAVKKSPLLRVFFSKE